MSNDSHRGYLFGILQRGARPVGHGNRASRPLAGQPAYELSETINYPSPPTGIATPLESTAADGFSETTLGLSQTNQPTTPQNTQSVTSLSTHAADALQQASAANVLQVHNSSAFDFQPADSPSDQAAPSEEVSPGESVAAASSKTTTLNQVAQPAHSQIVPSGFAVPDQAGLLVPLITSDAESSPNRTTPSANRSSNSSQPGAQPLASLSDQVKPSTTASIGESFAGQLRDSGHVDATSGLQTGEPALYSPMRTGYESRENPTTRVTRSARSSQSEGEPVDPSQLLQALADEPGAADSLASDPVPTSLSEPRRPRLIVLEQGGKTSGNSSTAADRRRQAFRDENVEAEDSQPFADPATEELGPSFAFSRSGQAPTVRAFAKFETDQTPENRIFTRKTFAGETQVDGCSATILQVDPSVSSERPRLLPARELPAANNLPSEQSTELSQTARQQPGRRTSENIQPARFAQFRPRSPDAIVDDSKTGPAPAETFEKSSALSPSHAMVQPAQFSERTFGPPPQRSRPAPKLTINRLDIQIVGQSPAPTVTPPAPQSPRASGPPSDHWERLERYQLGHLQLII